MVEFGLLYTVMAASAVLVFWYTMQYVLETEVFCSITGVPISCAVPLASENALICTLDAFMTALELLNDVPLGSGSRVIP